MEQLNPAIEESWKIVLGNEFMKPYMSDLKAFLVEEKKKAQGIPSWFIDFQCVQSNGIRPCQGCHPWPGSLSRIW